MQAINGDIERIEEDEEIFQNYPQDSPSRLSKKEVRDTTPGGRRPEEIFQEGFKESSGRKKERKMTATSIFIKKMEKQDHSKLSD